MSIKSLLHRLFLATLLATFFIGGLPKISALSDSTVNSINLDSVWYDSTAGSCTTTQPTPKASGKVYVVGDSYSEGLQTAGLADDLKSQGFSDVKIDGSTGRTIDTPGTTGNKLSAMDAISADKAAVQAANTIIVVLGTNQPSSYDSTIPGFMDKLNSLNNAAYVYWLNTGNLYTPDASQKQANKAISSYSDKYKYTVMDWYSIFRQDPSKYFDNTGPQPGLHPNDTGYKAIIDLINSSVVGAATTTSSSSACCGSSGGLSGNSNLQKIFNYLVQNGYTKEQAAGIIGNIVNESGGDPEIYQGDSQYPKGDYKAPPGSMGWGIVQWTPPTSIVEYAKNNNKPAYELQTQLELLINQLKVKAGKEIKATSTPEDAADVFLTLFEIPQDIAGEMPQREAAARIALKKYGSGVPSSGSCGDGAVAGDAVKTAINYAWPDYHDPPYFVFKPSYRAAIDAAISKGEYVGGGSHPGIDCGGFVTRVMRDSGADPKYNAYQSTTPYQKKYMDDHPEKYQNLGIKNSTVGLQPGDIAINDEHTYMYVGHQPGFHGSSASASFSTSGLAWRTPMADGTYFVNGGTGTPFVWYRLIK